MKSLVALFAPASRTRILRLTTPVATTNRQAADRHCSRNTKSRFVSALCRAQRLVGLSRRLQALRCTRAARESTSWIARSAARTAGLISVVLAPSVWASSDREADERFESFRLDSGPTLHQIPEACAITARMLVRVSRPGI